MKKRGFTLIELLAVIVVLAIIALIATPVILNVINTAKEGSVKSSALGYVDAIEKQLAIGLINSDTIDDGVYKPSDIKGKIKYKGKGPTKGQITIDKRQVISARLCIDNKSVKYEDSKAEMVEADYCNSKVTFEGETKEVTGDSITFEKTITTETNIMCTNEAVPSYENGQITITNIIGETTCGVYGTLQEGIESVDSSLSNIVMINDENPTTSISCSLENNRKDVAACIDNKSITLDMNGHSYNSSLSQTIYIINDSKLNIKGYGYIGNDKTISNSAAIVISGSKLNIKSEIADNCTSNSSETTKGLCLYGIYAINNLHTAEHKSYTNISNISTNGIIGVRNGSLDITNINSYSNSGSNVEIWSTTEKVNINGGTYISDQYHAFNIYNNNSIKNTAVININSTEDKLYIKVPLDKNSGIYNASSTTTVNVNGTEADKCTENSDDTTTGLCIYGFNGIVNDGTLIINNGTVTAISDAVYNRNLAIINGGVFIANNAKALTCVNQKSSQEYDAVCYINGGYFENKNLGVTNTTTNWGSITAEVAANIYANNFIAVGKFPISSQVGKKTEATEDSIPEIYLCSGNLKSTERDIRGTGIVGYSDKVVFTDGTNNPTLLSASVSLIPNYAGTCKQ